MTRIAAALALAVSLCTPAAVAGQITLIPHAGMLGPGTSGGLTVGADIAGALGPSWSLRGGFEAVSLRPEHEAGDRSWELTLPSMFKAVVDHYPGSGDLRVSGGLLLRTSNTRLFHDPDGTIQVGDGSYESTETGVFVGEMDQSPLAPFLSVGWGRATAPGVGPFVEAGVGLTSSPTVTLGVTGDIREEADFQADLERDRVALEDDLSSSARVWTLLTAGIRIGF